MPVGSLHQLIVCKQCGLLSTVYTVTVAIYQKNLWDKEIGFQIKTSMIQSLPRFSYWCNPIPPSPPPTVQNTKTWFNTAPVTAPLTPYAFAMPWTNSRLDLVLAFIHCIIDTSSRPYYSFHPPHPFIPLSIFNANKYHSDTSHSLFQPHTHTVPLTSCIVTWPRIDPRASNKL